MTDKAERRPFTVGERRTLLDEFFALGARLDATPAGEEEDAEDRARFAERRREYRERLPRLVLSRCPITDAVYEHSFDPFGLDGLWWDHRSPNRPLELLCGSVVAFTGAVKLGEPLERAPFLCRPGPGAPFVVPRILRHEHARAVIWSLPIGVHTGYVIVYFADPQQPDIEPFNDWGTDFYQFESDVDRMGWDQAVEEASDYDYELEKYVSSGQLLWIAPGDDSMTLRHGIEGCPYLDLEGSRLPQLLQDGEVWYDELPAEPSEEAVSTPAVAVSSAVAAPPSAPTCFSCGGVLKPTSKFCPSCGRPVTVAKPAPAPGTPPSVCRHCGKPRRPQAKFCANCGKA